MHVTVNMERYSIKIQSISDIITNSSSEVFPVRAKWYAESSLKDIITAILAAGGSEYKCDDLFEVTVNCGEFFVTPKINRIEIKEAADRLTCLEELFEPCDED